MSLLQHNNTPRRTRYVTHHTVTSDNTSAVHAPIDDAPSQQAHKGGQLQFEQQGSLCRGRATNSCSLVLSM